MKRTLLKRKIQAHYVRGRFLALALYFLLASASLVQAADPRIAFMSTRNSDNGEIFLMNPDGKRVRQLTRHLEYDAVPAWSPDGKKITFMSFRDKHKPDGHFNGDVYVMNADGTNPINLTQTPGRHDLDSCWSPDGKQIVFTAFKGFLTDIWVMDADGGNPRNLTNHGAKDRSPDWSPDGNQIAFVSNRDGDDNWEIYVMNADGTNPINLTNHPAADRGPDWSPDGNQIVFVSNRDGDWERNPKDNWEVFVMNADGANPINLTNHPAWDSSPAWEPAPALSVSPKGRLATLWGNVKRDNAYGAK